MEDPWANAWGEPAKPVTDPQTTWSQSSKLSVSGLSDAEDDIAVPSWATSADVPSEDQTTLWHPNLPPAKEWVISTYEDLPLGKPSSDSISEPDRSPSPEVTETTASSPVSFPESPKQHLDYISRSDDVIRSDNRSSAPGSPDAFGTFETGLDAEEADPWTQSIVSSDAQEPDTQGGDVWVPSWGASDSATEVQPGGKSIDEWEAARQQKERQDQHVPPHILASILDEFQSLSSDLWPPVAGSSGEENIGISDRRSGIDGVEGLTTIGHRLIPQDLTLPHYVQFSKTFTAKHMGDSLRLTRHVPIAHLSPFALYLASKGSTAWETSVKSRVEVMTDDFLPPGWRVVEKDKEESPAATDTKKKGSGGLLSFFGRRAPAAPLETNSRRSESPSRAPPMSTSVISSNAAVPPVTAVSSVDSVKSSPAGSSTPVLLGSSASLAISSDSTNASPAQSSQPTSDLTQPSAVSRFLTRFSRGKTTTSSPRNSLALSTDDLEFLSDMVPSANDEADEASQLRDLSTMISSSPLPTVLPPPLAPPPKPAPRRVTSNMSSTASGRPPPHSGTHDDLFSLFDSTSSSGKRSVPPIQRVTDSFSLSFTQPPAGTSTIPPLPPPTPTSFRVDPQGTGSSTSSRSVASPFDFPIPSTSRSQSPLPTKRTPVAIMSIGSSSINNSRPHSPLPAPPILPPPPNSKPTTAQPLPPKVLDEDFTDFYSPPPPQPSLPSDTSMSSIFSDKSLVSNSSSISAKTKNDFFDDFDDFISSPVHDPSPPRPPAKPTSFGHKPIAQQTQVSPQPPIKHPSPPPRKVSRAADHQRTISLVDMAVARPGIWPAAPTPLPEARPPPVAAQPTSTTGMQMQQVNGNLLGPSVSSSNLPLSFPPPPGFSSLRTTMSPSPPPQLRIASPNELAQSRHLQPPLLTKVTPSPAPAASGGLSAQDLSFFEGM